MKAKETRIAVPFVAVALSGCATVPHVTLNYHRVKWTSLARITQTVACNQAKTQIVALNTPSVATAYSSNLSKVHKLEINNLDAWFADAEFTAAFTEDGRLKSINQSSTGQGEAIVKSVVALAAVAAPLFSASAASNRTVLDECKTIDSWGGGKPVALTYEAKIDASKIKKPDADKSRGALAEALKMEPTDESSALFERLKGRLPTLKVLVGPLEAGPNVPSYREESATKDRSVLLELQTIGSFVVSFRRIEKVVLAGKEAESEKGIGTARVVVPTDDVYRLPIPKAALFGKQTFSLALSEAGAVTSIGYGKNAGATGAMNAISSIAGTEAARLTAEADLIAAQQRLLTCETKPADCK